MKNLSPIAAIIWATIIAGVLDIAAVFGYWLLHNVPPDAILRSIATSVIGPAAHEGGAAAAAIGLALHFLVSFVFAAGYVLAALRLRFVLDRPILFGILYGVLAYIIMVFAVVPLSLATFDGPWPPELVNLIVSVSIHLFLFGLPIGLVASRMRR